MVYICTAPSYHDDLSQVYDCLDGNIYQHNAYIDVV